MEFLNQTGMEFSDISSEKFRVYVFPGGDEVTVKQPQKLHVSDSGGHRVWDGQGVSHYIPAGWIHLFWEAHANSPHFVK